MSDPLDRRPNGGLQVASKETAVTPVERPNAWTAIKNNARPILVALVLASAGILAAGEEGLFVLPSWLKVVVGIILIAGMALGIRPKKNKDGTVVIAGSPEDSNVINAKKEE